MALGVREMDVFRRIMLTGSVTAAAEALNISQPAVSRMLQQAEERLGFRLFLRRRKRLVPTAEAQTLLAEVVNVFAAIEQTQRLAVDLRDGNAGLLTLATVAGLAHTIIPRAVQRFRIARPHVSVVIHTLTGPEVVARVAQGSVDLGLGVGPVGHPAVDSAVLCETDIVCVMPTGHPLAAKRVLNAADLAGEPIICPGPQLSIGAAIVGAFAEANLRLRVAVETSQSTTAYELVRVGAGVAILDGLGLMAARIPDLVTRPFQPTPASVARLLWSKERLMPRLAMEFSDTARQVAAELVSTRS